MTAIATHRTSTDQGVRPKPDREASAATVAKMSSTLRGQLATGKLDFSAGARLPGGGEYKHIPLFEADGHNGKIGYVAVVRTRELTAGAQRIDPDDAKEMYVIRMDRAARTSSIAGPISVDSPK